jgi:hypothetical protein
MSKCVDFCLSGWVSLLVFAGVSLGVSLGVPLGVFLPLAQYLALLCTC